MNELQASKQWYKRGKAYRAKTLDALKELHAPGHEPKGIVKDAQKPQRAKRKAQAKGEEVTK